MSVKAILVLINKMHYIGIMNKNIVDNTNYLLDKPVYTNVLQNFKSDICFNIFSTVFLKFAVLLIGFSTITALIKYSMTCTDTYESELNRMNRNTITTNINFTKYFVDSIALILLAYLRSIIDYENLANVFFVISISIFISNLTTSYLISSVLVKYIYHVLILKPTLNFLLFLYLGDFAQKYHRALTINELTLQNLATSAISGLLKVVMTAATYTNSHTVLNISMSFMLIFLNLALFILKKIESQEEAEFRPAIDKFNASNLISKDKIFKLFSNKLITYVILSVVLFQFLDIFYGSLKIRVMELMNSKNKMIPIVLQVDTNSITNINSNDSTELFKSINSNNLQSASTSLKTILISIKVALKNIKEYFTKSIFKINVAYAPVQNNSAKCSNCKNCHAAKMAKSVMLSETQYVAILKETLTGQFLQILLFLGLVLLEAVGSKKGPIAGFMLVPILSYINTIYNMYNLVELHHQYIAIDMAIKKTTKDYTYSKCDYETKSFLKIFLEIYIEFITKFATKFFTKNLVKNNVVMSTEIPTVLIKPIVPIVSIVASVIWLYISAMLVYEIETIDEKIDIYK